MKRTLLYCLIIFTSTLWSCRTDKPLPAMSIAGFAVKYITADGVTDSVAKKALPQMLDLDEQLQRQLESQKTKPARVTVMACCLPCPFECCDCPPEDTIHFMGVDKLKGLELIPVKEGPTVKANNRSIDDVQVFGFGVKNLEGDFTLRITGEFNPGELNIPVRIEKIEKTEKKVMMRRE